MNAPVPMLDFVGDEEFRFHVRPYHAEEGLINEPGPPGENEVSASLPSVLTWQS